MTHPSVHAFTRHAGLSLANWLSKVLTGAALGFFSSAAVPTTAGELPDYWLGRSTDEFGSMRFSCRDSTKAAQRKTCKFTYEVLRLNEQFTKQQVEMEQELKKGDAWKQFHDDMCLQFKQKTSAEILKEVDINLKKRNYNEAHLRITKKMLGQISDACRERTYASTLRMMKLTGEVASNTCYIRRWASEIELSAIKQSDGKRSIWLNEGRPYGSCGLKKVVKIIPSEKTKWAVSFEYVVLNPEGIDGEGRTCRRYQTLKHSLNQDLVSEWGLPCSLIKLNSQYLDPEVAPAPFPQ